MNSLRLKYIFIAMCVLIQTPLQAFDWPKPNWWYVGSAMVAVTAITFCYFIWSKSPQKNTEAHHEPQRNQQEEIENDQPHNPPAQNAQRDMNNNKGEYVCEVLPRLAGALEVGDLEKIKELLKKGEEPNVQLSEVQQKILYESAQSNGNPDKQIDIDDFLQQIKRRTVASFRPSSLAFFALLLQKRAYGEELDMFHSRRACSIEIIRCLPEGQQNELIVFFGDIPGSYFGPLRGFVPEDCLNIIYTVDEAQRARPQMNDNVSSI